ncbi:unnamed protein product [Amoebophrya sp. A120]|nr:unnamed protein product [Amoebophrya sp. A120]|eukprot:GSA120T00014458001.1
MNSADVDEQVVVHYFNLKFFIKTFDPVPSRNILNRILLPYLDTRNRTFHRSKEVSRTQLEAEELYGPIRIWDCSAIQDFSALFSRFPNFSSTARWYPRLNNPDDVETSYFNSDISAWDVSGATNMAGMFLGCAYFDRKLKHWDVSNVTTMRGMFAGCENFNQDIKDWNVAKLKDVEFMFDKCERFKQDLRSWRDIMTVEGDEDYVKLVEACLDKPDIWGGYGKQSKQRSARRKRILILGGTTT